MTTQTSNQLTCKLFIGQPITSEVRMHLNRSDIWKQLCVSPLKERHALIEIHHHGKNYLGFYLEHEKVGLHELTAIESQIKEKISSYCLKLESQSLNPCIFVQLFIA